MRKGEAGCTPTQKLYLLQLVETEERFYKKIMRYLQENKNDRGGYFWRVIIFGCSFNGWSVSVWRHVQPKGQRGVNHIIWETFKRYIVKSPNSIISPNILMNIYLKFIISFTYLNPFLSDKEASFIYFMSTHGNHFIYNYDTINIITSFIEHCIDPVILNLYVQYSNTSHSLVISGIHYAPVSYEFNIHKLVPTNNQYYYKTLKYPLFNTDIPDKAIDPVIAYFGKRKPIIMCDFCLMINHTEYKCMLCGPAL